MSEGSEQQANNGPPLGSPAQEGNQPPSLEQQPLLAGKGDEDSVPSLKEQELQRLFEEQTARMQKQMELMQQMQVQMNEMQAKSTPVAASESSWASAGDWKDEYKKGQYKNDDNKKDIEVDQSSKQKFDANWQEELAPLGAFFNISDQET